MSDKIYEDSAEAEQDGKGTLLLEDGQQIDGKLNGYANDRVFNAKGEKHPLIAVEIEINGGILKTWVRKGETHIPAFGEGGQALDISGRLLSLAGAFSEDKKPLLSEFILVDLTVNQA